MDPHFDTTRVRRAEPTRGGQSTLTIAQRVLVSLIVAMICAFTWFVEKLPNGHRDL